MPLMRFHVRMHNENVQYLKLPIIMIIITNATADLSVFKPSNAYTLRVGVQRVLMHVYMVV